MYRIPMMLLAASVVAAVPFVAGCQSTEVATERKQVVYQGYEYFPNSEVYFSQESKTFFWHTPEGAWAKGQELPEKYHLENEPSVSLQLSTEKPYERHPEIHAIYPANQPLVVEDR